MNCFKKIISTLIAAILAGCATTAEDVAEVVVTVPLYGVVAVPAAVTYPFWKSASEAHRFDEFPKDKEQLSALYGEPKTKYICDKVEVWEYLNNGGESEYVVLHEPGKTAQVTKVSNLKNCSVIEGEPDQAVQEFWIAEVLPCGMNYQKQIHDRDVFFIDLKKSQGAVRIEYSVFHHAVSYDNAWFDVIYEGETIYENVGIGTRYDEQVKSKIDVVEAKFGPGESNFLEVRVRSKPRSLLGAKYYYDFWVSCPD